KKLFQVRRRETLHHRIMGEAGQNLGADAFRNVPGDQHEMQLALAARQRVAANQQNPRPQDERKQTLHRSGWVRVAHGGQFWLRGSRHSGSITKRLTRGESSALNANGLSKLVSIGVGRWFPPLFLRCAKPRRAIFWQRLSTTCPPTGLSFVHAPGMNHIAPWPGSNSFAPFHGQPEIL